MQFSMDEDDIDFNLASASRSRLSSLFQGEGTSGDVNQALMYTAPKQPKKTDNTQNNASALKLIHLVVGHGYKLENGKYNNQGSLGCAILGNHETSNYKFLLYKGKQVQVAFCNIVPSFSLSIHPNNYVSFCDEKKENWYLNFDSEASLIELAKQVALAKANCQGKEVTSLVIQDLAIGEGKGLENNDSAVIKFTGWFMSNFSFGQVFETNMNTEASLRLCLGKSKVIKGWHEGLQGAKKNSKRLLIIPPTLTYGAETLFPTIPPNSTLIFEIHITKVKFSRESSHSPSPSKVINEGIPEKKPEVPPRTHSLSQDESIRLRGASISEQLTQSPKKDKAQLISRMAKMGTATLPLQGAIPAQVSSESENEDETLSQEPMVLPEVTKSRNSPKAVSKPRSRTSSGGLVTTQQQIHPHPIQSEIPIQLSQHSSQVSLFTQATLPNQQQFVPSSNLPFPSYPSTLGNQFQVSQPQFPLHSIPGMVPTVNSNIVDTHLPLLINENRNQNTEVRLNLSKISDKVDTVIQKVDDLRTLHSIENAKAQMPLMEASILAQNIQRIVQENQQLREEADLKNSKIQSLNEKICDLLQKNQRFFEESNCMLEQRRDSLQVSSTQTQARIQILEQEKEKLANELANALSKLNASESSSINLEQMKETLYQKNLASEEQIKNLEKLLNEIKMQLKEKEMSIISLQDELKNTQHEKKLLQTYLQNNEEKLSELVSRKDFLEKNLTESKEKIQQIKLRSESDLTEQLTFYKEEIQNLEAKLREKTSLLANMENTSNKSDESEKIQSELKEMLIENKNLKEQIISLQEKLNNYAKSDTEKNEKIQDLISELEHAQSWKRKYEVFYEKTCALKANYESQISELMSEIKHLQSMRKSLNSETDFSVEIKKAMNALYRLLQGKFDATTSYTGSMILEISLQVIRGLTFQLLEQKNVETPEKPKIESGTVNEINPENLQNSVAVNEEENKHSITKDQDSTLFSSSEIQSSNVSALSEQNGIEIEDKEQSIKEESNNSQPDLDNSKIEHLNLQNVLEIDTSEKTNGHIVSETQSEISESSNDQNRVSPDIWKPQPPPLFDDDDDDDDDWLK